ncbi:Glutathione S-transferase omega-like 2 [Talaromyces islandicus]|uniref:Glutathione S-transferase omega-like 2 n=1 Tax=Talaromyces islandicus TaxID=28573 RepID=A0A0U1M8X7_TALIS|nr:Glutathione S-transferase omega-like 2 [Talaromyces islandicus]
MAEAKSDMTNLVDRDGHFRRKDSSFRSFISRSASAEFPAEAGRYVLYINLGCPWAHRTNIVRSLKGLEDIIQLVKVGRGNGNIMWEFNGTDGSDEKEPLYGFNYLKDLYLKVEPGYEGRYTVPLLWDKKTERIVSNESSDIIRMFYSEFDDLLPAERREDKIRGLYPEHLRSEIDAMNVWVYNQINNGVYKSGFATSQEAYDANVYALFEALDRVEKHLGEPGHQPYLFGDHITEADIRLYPTIVRFDVAYHPVFKCNIKMIRHDYPRIHRWLRLLYWDESAKTTRGAFKKTSALDLYKKGYGAAVAKLHGIKLESLVLPAGPLPAILPFDG